MHTHQILISEDGSNTLHNKELDETFHSIHGAIQESNHVFISAGIEEYFARNSSVTKLNLLEIGFGTGLNTLLSIAYLKNKGIGCFYHSIEKYPIDPKLLHQLNYGEELNISELYATIIDSKWEEKVILDKASFLLKEKVDLLEFKSETLYDIILFDAFSPDKQGALWTEEVFRNIYKHTNPNGILTTYSAKGQVRRNMQAAGFKVERIPGPVGKREMLRATKIETYDK